MKRVNKEMESTIKYLLFFILLSVSTTACTSDVDTISYKVTPKNTFKNIKQEDYIRMNNCDSIGFLERSGTQSIEVERLLDLQQSEGMSLGGGLNYVASVEIESSLQDYYGFTIGEKLVDSESYRVEIPPHSYAIVIVPWYTQIEEGEIQLISDERVVGTANYKINTDVILMSIQTKTYDCESKELISTLIEICDKYIMKNDEVSATDCISDILEIDPNNSSAKSYLQNLYATQTASVPTMTYTVEIPTVKRKTNSPIQNYSVTPEQFIREYYSVINDRDYERTWGMLTNNFKDRNNCCNSDGTYTYNEYVSWWNSVREVEIINVSITREYDDSVIINVNVRYYKKDGRIGDEKHEFKLIMVSGEMGWMID